MSLSEEDQPYYFESDHVALKENEDYRNLLHAIILLESQRQLAAQDIETLHEAQNKAIADPMKFVEDLQKGQSTGFPKPQVIRPLPEIQWDKYTNSVDFSSFGSVRHMTRNKKSGNDGSGSAEAVQSLKSKLIQGLDSSCTSANDPSVIVVRGRAKDSSKSETFNQLWTEEEQQRLEKFLIQFPPEEVESRRWGKIADALGNRTTVQVASRVQKYFLRLAKEGLPVPGRMPNLSAHNQKGSHRHHRYNRLYNNTSTFMQSHLPPVWMADEGEDSGMSFSSGNNFDDAPSMSEATIQREDSSDDEGFPQFLQNTPEYRELKKLQRLKREKMALERRVLTKHVGYKCDNCGTEPIIGTRWHCIDCPSGVSYDFCDDCKEVPFQHEMHNSSHRLQPLTQVCLDSDYMSFTKNDYNYLDSNYMPAS